MAIKDSNLFNLSAGSSMIRKYTPGMTVEYGETIRSAINHMPYVRFSTSPAVLTVTSDPSLWQSHFVLDDHSTPIGTIQSFPDTMTTADGMYFRNGQIWAKTGYYFQQPAYFTRPVPRELFIFGDYWGGTVTAPNNSTIIHVAGDGNGNWMAIASNGIIYKCSNNAYGNWTQLSSLSTTPDAKVATNGKGRWWICNNTGQIYVSDDFGVGWAQQLSPLNSAPAIFKCINGKLIIRAGFSLTPANGSSVIAYYVADTAGTSAYWTSIILDAAKGASFGAGVTLNILDAVGGDGVDTIWFAGPMSNGYQQVLVWTISTGAWALTNTPYANTFLGLCYDDIVKCAWIHCGNWANSTTNVDLYEMHINTAGGTWYSTNYQRPARSSPILNSARSAYFRRGGSVFTMINDGIPFNDSDSSTHLFRVGVGMLANARAPLMNGNMANVKGWRGMAIAGDSICVYGTSLAMSFPILGIATQRIPSPGMIDYIRMQ